MMKYIIFSFDDGTIHDKKLIEILNKYNLKATFNLNSGLDDFVWYLGDTKIERLKLKENVRLYDNHEVCAHSLTHPRLDECSKENLDFEVRRDKENLEKIFNRTINGFATPFETYNQDVIDKIKECGFKFARVANRSTSTLHKESIFELAVDCLTFENNVKEKLEAFLSNSLDEDFFVIAGHSYEYYVNNTWCEFESLCHYISQTQNLKTITTTEFVNKLLA